VIDAGALYDEHWPAVYRFLRRRVADAQTAEDLTADVFLRVLQAADRYQDQGKPGAWLQVIARNLLIDHYRRGTSVPIDSEAPGGQATLDAGSDRQLTAIRVAEALRRLPERQRMALIEQYLIGSSLEDSALVLRCTADNIKTLRHRGHARLRQILLETA